jgi:DNA-binding PadR family transcriptional regulator
MNPFRNPEGWYPGPHAHAGQRHPRGGRPFPPEGGPFPGGGPFPPHGGFSSHGGRGGSRGRGRAPRGDVRAAVLLLLAEQPMHGYQLMQAIGERSGGRWTPSPGAIYPTLSQLEDEGLVTVTAEAGRKLATLTDAGRQQAEALRGGTTDPFASVEGRPAGPDLRRLIEELHGAVRQVARTGTEAQLSAAAAVLAEARRSLYLLLADGPDGAAPGDAGTPEA